MRNNDVWWRTLRPVLKPGGDESPLASDCGKFQNAEVAGTNPGNSRLAEKAAVDCTAAEACIAVML